MRQFREPMEIPPPAFILFSAFLFGSLIGSFFNVVIYRMPRGQSVAWPPSHCVKCDYRIRFYDNIPVISWLLLRGKCRSCRTPIGWIYPLVELFTAATAVAVAAWVLSHDYPPDFVVALFFFTLVSVPILVIDLRHFLIPDLFTFPGMALGLGLSLYPGGISFAESLMGGAGAGGLLWLVGFAAEKALRKEAMGLGDVKLLAMAGTLFGLKAALLGLVFASFLGCLLGIPFLLIRGRTASNHIPFGPFICAGVLIAVLAGDKIWAWYFSLMPMSTL